MITILSTACHCHFYLSCSACTAGPISDWSLRGYFWLNIILHPKSDHIGLYFNTLFQFLKSLDIIFNHTFSMAICYCIQLQNDFEWRMIWRLKLLMALSRENCVNVCSLWIFPNCTFISFSFVLALPEINVTVWLIGWNRLTDGTENPVAGPVHTGQGGDRRSRQLPGASIVYKRYKCKKT